MEHRKVYTMNGAAQAADALADIMAKLPPTHRLGWICYLFEALDSELPNDEFDLLLSDTLIQLKNRRDLGGW